MIFVEWPKSDAKKLLFGWAHTQRFHLTLERTTVLHVHFPSCVLQNNDVKWSNTAFYYIDTGVLLKNTPLVKFIRNYIRDLSGVFPYPAFSRLFMSGWLFVYIIKRTLHVSSKISKLCSRGKNNISRVSAGNQ